MATVKFKASPKVQRILPNGTDIDGENIWMEFGTIEIPSGEVELTLPTSLQDLIEINLGGTLIKAVAITPDTETAVIHFDGHVLSSLQNLLTLTTESTVLSSVPYVLKGIKF